LVIAAAKAKNRVMTRGGFSILDTLGLLQLLKEGTYQRLASDKMIEPKKDNPVAPMD
jgi:hypothetical protein